MKKLAYVVASAGVVAALATACVGGEAKDPGTTRGTGSLDPALTYASECHEQPALRLCGTTEVLAVPLVDSVFSDPGIGRRPGTVVVVDENTARYELTNYLTDDDVEAFLGSVDATFEHWDESDVSADNQRHFTSGECTAAGDVNCEIFWEVRPGPAADTSDRNIYVDVVLTVRLKSPSAASTAG